MRIFEIVIPKFYLCTSSPQKLGKTLSLDDEMAPLGAEIEAALEAKRPDGHLSRAKSIYLLTQPRAADFVYRADPEGLERQHAGWLLRLSETDPSQAGVMAHYAHGYWSGEECPEARSEPWEYRSASVKLLSRVGGTSSTFNY